MKYTGVKLRREYVVTPELAAQLDAIVLENERRALEQQRPPLGRGDTWEDTRARCS